MASTDHSLCLLFDALIHTSCCFACLSRSLLPDRRWFNVIQRLSELKVDVCLYTTDLIIRLTLQDVNGIVHAGVLNVDGVSFVQSSIIG